MIGERLMRLQTYLSEKDCKTLEREATARRLTRSSCMRRILESHLRHQRDLVGVTDHPEAAGAAEMNILARLREHEERVAATVRSVGDELAWVEQTVQLVMAMVDRVYLGLMVHLPEVPERERAGAVASAERRHLQWQRHVRTLAEAGGPEAGIRYGRPSTHYSAEGDDEPA